jgi:HAD superfamily hydrolase (TIGR01509 family)
MTGGGPGRGAVIFDCDGVLADTQACWDAAFQETAEAFGIRLSPGQLRRLRGASIGAAAAAISATLTGASAGQPGPARPRPSQAPQAEGPVVRVLRRELRVAIDRADLRLLPGVEEALHIVRGGPVGVASNGPEDVVRTVLRRLGIGHAFDVILSADDVAAPKPAPDLYHLACDRLRRDPAHAAAVEDSPAGITAALAAGLAVLAVGSDSGRSSACLGVTTLADPAALDWLRQRSQANPA